MVPVLMTKGGARHVTVLPCLALIEDMKAGGRLAATTPAIYLQASVMAEALQ